jgi:PAS domain-containing protein
MYRLVIIAGPNQGTSYPLREGENILGRQSGNSIVLQSTKVSKKHCSVTVSGLEVSVKDEGSSNGTFVNGSLIRSKKIKPGDRLSLGEFVFELAEAQKALKAAAVGFGAGLNLSQDALASPSGATEGNTANLLNLSLSPGSSNEPPKELKDKIIWYFERAVMPVFYSLNLKYEWRMLCIYFFSVFILGNLLITVYPLLESSRVSIVKESILRARFIARQIADQNAPFLAQKAETRTEIGIAEHAEGVQMAVLTDLENRILAPGKKLNQYLAGGVEAEIAINARDLFRKGRETGIAREAGLGTVVAVEPVKILNPMLGRNVVVAMAVVSIDTTLSTPDFGEMGMIYSQTLIMTGILGALIFLILYYLTLRPFQVLNEDMDRALKGDLSQVTHDFKLEELDPLWIIINSAIQRLPKGDASSSGENNISAEDFSSPLKGLGSFITSGVVILDGDKKILYINSAFEDMSGIRSEGSIGNEVMSVARDQSLGVFTNDLLDRAVVGSEGIFEDYDFSGVPCKVLGAAFGVSGQAPKCYLILVKKGE